MEKKSLIAKWSNFHSIIVSERRVETAGTAVGVPLNAAHCRSVCSTRAVALASFLLRTMVRYAQPGAAADATATFALREAHPLEFESAEEWME
eukprot:6050413-Prymnesium_polylepis.1